MMLEQFSILLWKSCRIRFNNIKKTCTLIMYPLFTLIILYIMRKKLKETTHNKPVIFKPFDIPSTATIISIFPNIAYSPNSSLISDTIAAIVPSFPNLQGFSNSKELERHLVKKETKKNTLCGIQFENSLLHASTFPTDIKITFRFPAESRFSMDSSTDWATNQLLPLKHMFGTRLPNDNEGGYPPGYYKEQFATIQHHVTLAVIKQLTGTAVESQVVLQRFPYPPYTEDAYFETLGGPEKGYLIGFFIMIFFIYTCTSIIIDITSEKETQVKEFMKIMGLSNGMYWLVWFIDAFTITLIPVIILIIVFKVPITENGTSMFPHSDVTVILAFMLLYIFALVTYCFMISNLFSKAQQASMFGGLIWFFYAIPAMIIIPQFHTTSTLIKFLTCLLCNTAMPFGFFIIIRYEAMKEGAQWNNMWNRIEKDDPFLFGHVMIMLLLSSVLQLLVALYLEAVLPGEYGIPKPWNFLCTKSFWRKSDPRRPTSTDNIYSDKPERQAKFIEEEPINLNAGIQIKALRKAFKNDHEVVKGLNLNMYEDQITALLGHNGAGKTTTISMLTGMFRPTSGTAKIAGHDILTDMSKARTSLGLCPQANFLFEELTVKDHLYFFGKLKGCSDHTIKQETNKYIRLVELEPKMKAKASTLSGGMKRKLCVCIALFGNSKVVMLDEPTAGMDPAARRAMWDLLLAEKKGRTILLTTHFMDEADILGDRIAILVDGALQCCGSSFFLKKKYGAGYHLILEVAPSRNVVQITQLFKSYIPNIEVNTNVGSELTYILPEDRLHVFEGMLRDLESKATSLGIVNYGMSLTTLEEVFIKVGADGIDEKHDDTNDTSGDMTVHCSSCNILTGLALYRNQFKAMMLKKYYFTKRAWIFNLVFIVFMAVFFIGQYFHTLSNLGDELDLSALDITLDSYDHPITVMDGAEHYAADYEKYIKQMGHTVKNFGTHLNVNDFISDKERKISKIRTIYIVGASFQKNRVIGWFSNEPYHALPLTLNLIHNAILRKQVGGDKKHNIRVTNYPLPYSPETKTRKMKELSTTVSSKSQISTIICFFYFLAGYYSISCIKERKSKFKHLQFVSGLNILIYWFACYLFDLLHFIVFCLFFTVIIAVFQIEQFRTFNEIGRLFLILTLFGFAMLPVIYFAFIYFAIPAEGYMYVLTFCIFLGSIIPIIIRIIMAIYPDEEEIFKYFHYILMTIPPYNFMTALNNLNELYNEHKMCKQIAEVDETYAILKTICSTKKLCCDMDTDTFYYTHKKKGIAYNFIWFIITAVVFSILVIMRDFHIWRKIALICSTQKVPSPDQAEDEDVAYERHKVETATQTEINSHSLILKDLSKYYRKFLAVNRLCVGIQQSECFGLLGVNGAGKTTAFKMLTGDVSVSYGNAWVNGLSLKSDLQKIYRNISYCPQFDALIENLTCREIMTIIFLIRGVPKDGKKYMCEKLAVDFNFQAHIDKQVRTLSGGNKRKLSAAIAAIGNPLVLYLDEPSTGMDPAAKRKVWDSLCKVRDSGACLVLTSHSMEECEALCTRIAIMVNGTFKCLGSSQHLKSKFAQGYTLTVKVKKTGETHEEISSAEIQSIDNYIKQKFPNIVLKEVFQGLLTYHISDTNIALSSVFGIMEKGKKSLNIEDYSIGQCSLEEVFFFFAKHQKEESNIK